MSAMSTMSSTTSNSQQSSEEVLIANMKTLMVTIGDLKADMLRMLEEDSGKASCFRATSSEAAKLSQAIGDLEDRLGRVIDQARRETLPEVDARLADYPKVLEQLRAAELVHQAMSVISDIQCRMAALQVAVKKGEYLDCVDQVVSLDALFRKDLRLVKEDVQVLGLLRSLFITCKHSMHDAFLAMWAANFVFKDKLEKPLICSLTVASLTDAPRLVRAFQALKLFHSKVDAQLADTLLTRFFLPVIGDSNLMLECYLVNNQNNVTTMELVLVDTRGGADAPAGEEEAAKPPSPQGLCANLQPALVTLRDCLLSLPLDGDQSREGESCGGGGGTLADRLRPLIEDRLSERLITDCLAKTVPTDWEGLQSYAESASAVEALEHQLVSECRLVSQATSRIGEFVRDIAGVFVEKRVAAVLDEGRRLAAASLADSVLVDDAVIASALLGHAANDANETAFPAAPAATKEDEELVDKYIDGRAFAFPVCRVSRSAVDLVAFIGRVCREALNTPASPASTASDDASETCGGGGSSGYSADLRWRLGLCCRKLLLLYRDTASAVHAEQLGSVPQLAALYYNSCQYLAYSAIDIEHRYASPLLSSARQSQSSSSPPPPKCLVDTAAALRADGARVFLAQLASQRQLVLEPLTHLTLGQQSQGGSYEANSRLCRQSLHQIQCLGRVWSVLPAKIHCKSLGSLSHCLLAALVAFTLSQEDFDCRDADDLARIFQWVQERLGAVFAEVAPSPDGSQPPERWVPGWQRFRFLGEMLCAPLAAFPDLWCDGKSPLAGAFSDAEVRGLVKALFTNTDDRAAVLAKIT